jgi:mRNA interferase HigB
VHIITKKRLKEFAKKHEQSAIPLRLWHTLARKNKFKDFHHIKEVFPSADVAGECTVFDIAGNNCRLVTIIRYKYGKIYIRHVFTHAEYTRWNNTDDKFKNEHKEK